VACQCRGVPVKDGHWGYRLLVVEDLDGNQLFFNDPNEPGLDPTPTRNRLGAPGASSPSVVR
jgi:hypothetical protein